MFFANCALCAWPSSSFTEHLPVGHLFPQLHISDIAPPLPPHLWDFHILILLVTAVPVLPDVPVSIDQVPVEPEQGFCVVEVSEHLIWGQVHIQVL